MKRTNCSSIERIASYLQVHLVSLSNFSDRDNKSHSTSISLKEATHCASTDKIIEIRIVSKVFFKFGTKENEPSNARLSLRA